MGLNEHEQRVLEELERGLYADDEQLARRMQKVAAKAPDRQRQASAARRIAGVLVAIAGLGVILVGAIIHWPWMGAAGFVITLAGLAVATGAVGGSDNFSTLTVESGGSSKSPGGVQTKTAPKQSASKVQKPHRKNFIQRINDFFEDRWNGRSF